MTKEEATRRKEAIDAENAALWNQINVHAEEEKRVVYVLKNSDKIIEQLNVLFQERTKLSATDLHFLVLATALQLCRIYLLPRMMTKFPDDQRLDQNDKRIKDEERKKVFEYKEQHKDWVTKESHKGYRSWQEIAFTIKVPYDSIRHAGEFGRNMHGGQHRVKTLGHDPILGWIFGTANILTDTITICPEYMLGEKSLRLPLIESYDVDMGSNFCWTNRTTNASVFTNSLESIGEDRHRLYAALFAQGLHLESDKFTKLGLPVPFLSSLAPDKAYEIYRNGYDYLDMAYDMQLLKRTSKSAAQAIIINTLIGALHKFFYNPTKDHDMQLYDIRTRKIITYSNTIATSSDVIRTAMHSFLGDESAITNFDLGSFLITLKRLFSDMTFITKIKEEFVQNEWDKTINSDNNILNI